MYTSAPIQCNSKSNQGASATNSGLKEPWSYTNGHIFWQACLVWEVLGCYIEQQHSKFHIYKQEPRNLAWYNAPRVSLKVSGKLPVHPDSWWQVDCSLKTSLWSHLQVGASVSSFAHLMNALSIRKAWGQETSCSCLSKLYWVNCCVREPLSNRPESVWVSWIWYLLGIRSWRIEL